MLNINKPFLTSSFIFALFLLPMTKAVSDGLPQQVSQLQTKLKEANEKVATLASDQHKTDLTISVLQANLNTAHQELSDLKIIYNQLAETNTVAQR
ncbi:MAG: hypothetical protein WAW61_07635, partial [Methylococcaceae bacterium]